MWYPRPRGRQSPQGFGPRTARRNCGFTLLELVLALGILSSLALTATAFVANRDDQQRFEASGARLDALRRAVIGEPGSVYGGQALASGHVADNGILPGALSQLGSTLPTGFQAQALLNPAFDATPDASSGLPTGTTVSLDDASCQISKGWRAGTLYQPPSGGSYRDGYGFDFQWSLASDVLTMTSLGSDNAAGGTGYAQDLSTVIAQADWSHEVSNVEVRVRNDTGSTISGNLRTSVLVFLNSASSGAFKRYTSDATADLAAGGEATLRFAAGGYPGGSYTSTRLPLGRHLFVAVKDTDDVAHSADDVPYPDAATARCATLVCYHAGCPSVVMVLR